MQGDGKGQGRGRPRWWWQVLLVLALGLHPALAPAADGASSTTGTLRLGGDANYPPYHFRNARGEADGFDIDLAQGIAADLGLDLVVELGDWAETLERLDRGELDAVPMFWSAERGRRFLFSEPILLRHHALFGHYETPAVASLDALVGGRVAVQDAGLAWEALRDLDRPDVSIVGLDNEGDTLQLVASGGADYALVPTGIGYDAIRRSDLHGLVALSPPLLERKYVYAIRRGRPDLVPLVNGALERLGRSGVQNELYVQWIGSPVMRGSGDAAADAAARTDWRTADLAGAALLLAGLALLAWRRRPARPGPAVAATRGHGAPADAALVAGLREAIADGSLGFALQPRIDLRSGHWIGAELLARWEHPRLGTLDPDTFVPAAEQAGTIGEMTLYLVRHGLAHARDWPDTGHPLHISINVSANDLADARLVDAIIEASAGGRIGLMLEITETEVMREPEHVASALPRLRACGIRISVDDFGAGHSSLVNLRRLAPDELKIDRSFVQPLLESRSDQAIVRASIDLGHELGARVAAEGVEDDATRAWLLDAGCDAAQGFGIARPMPPGEFVALLRSCHGIKPASIPGEHFVNARLVQ